jgi:2-phosphosulfolactate phosphatase
MNNKPLFQHPFHCKLDWGQRGALRAVQRGDILVVVDTLSFSTAVATAVNYGGFVCPCPEGEDPVKLARRIGGEAAVRRADVPQKGHFSLSPLTYVNLSPGTRIVLSSPNGATCSHCSRQVPYLFIGALLNARAVASAVSNVLNGMDSSACMTVIACGERESTLPENNPIRFAVEDYLGAGAILSYLGFEKSPEARVCQSAFADNKKNMRNILWECESGRELRAEGFGKDVEFASQLNLYDSVPVMRNGFFSAVYYSDSVGSI